MFNRFVTTIYCSLTLAACSAVSSPEKNNKNMLAPSFNQPASTVKSSSYQSSVTEAKYQVLNSFPNPFFCDFNQFPIARSDSIQARDYLPELQKNQEEFQVILKHHNLTGVTALSDEQILLIYRDHQKLQAIQVESAERFYKFQLQVMESKQQGFIIKGLVDSNGIVKVKERIPNMAMCPVCLAQGTQISTPKGVIAVENLHEGDNVWTIESSGKQIEAKVLKTAHVIVPNNHQIVHLVLEDKRELWISAGHPTADKRAIGDLQKGDVLDGSRIVEIAKEIYKQTETYDLLPSGATGYYWANGILVGSTLSKTQR